MMALAFAFLVQGVFGQDKIPQFSDLAASSFEAREQAQKKIWEWVVSDHETARDVLLKEYLRTKDPEVRVRLVPLLERSYFRPRGYVGVVMMPDSLDQFGRPKNGEEAGLGVRITEVAKGTPAERSGIKPEDVVIRINDWEVRGGFNLR